MERLTKKPSTSQTSVNSPLFVEFSQVSEVAPLHIKRDAKEITNTPFLVCPLHHLRPGAGDSEQAPQTSRPPRRAAPAASSPPPPAIHITLVGDTRYESYCTLSMSPPLMYPSTCVHPGPLTLGILRTVPCTVCIQYQTARTPSPWRAGPPPPRRTDSKSEAGWRRLAGHPNGKEEAPASRARERPHRLSLSTLRPPPGEPPHEQYVLYVSSDEWRAAA